MKNRCEWSILQAVLSIVFFSTYQTNQPIQKPTDQNHQTNKPGIIGSNKRRHDRCTRSPHYRWWVSFLTGAGPQLRGLAPTDSNGHGVVVREFYRKSHGFLIILIPFNMFQVSLWNFYEFCSQPLWSHCFAGHGFAATNG
jgi:hypothetical protein